MTKTRLVTTLILGAIITFAIHKGLAYMCDGKVVYVTNMHFFYSGCVEVTDE